MTRKKSKYQLILAFAILASFFITSCSGLFNNEIEEPVETAVLNISLNEKTTRNILPQVSQLNNFKLTGTRGGETTTLGEWSSTEQLSEASIPLQVGEWNLTLTAKHNDVNFSGSATVNIERGKRNMASFILATQSTENGTAVVNVTFSTTYRVKAVRVIFGTSELAAGEYSLSSSRINFTKTVAAGNYPLTINFYSDVNKTESLGYYSDFVTVTSGLETAANIEVDYFSETPVFESIRNIENGIEFKVTIPANTPCEVIRREITSVDQLSESPSTWWWTARSLAFTVDNYTSETVTKTITDHYRIQAGKIYQYGMMLNWNSVVSPETIYVEADSNGWEIPVIATKMKAEIDHTNKALKYTQKPVIQFQNGESYNWKVKTWYNINVYNTNRGNDLEWHCLYYDSVEDNNESPIPEVLYGLTANYATTELELLSNDGNNYSTYIHYDNVGQNENLAIYEDLPRTAYVPNKVEEVADGLNITINVPKSTFYVIVERKIGDGNYRKILDRWLDQNNPLSKSEQWNFIDRYDYRTGVQNNYRILYAYKSNGQFYWEQRFDGGAGFSFTPTKNGVTLPRVNKFPRTSFDGETLTISKDCDITFYETEYTPFIHFVYNDSEGNDFWINYDPNTTDKTQRIYSQDINGKTLNLRMIRIYYNFPVTIPGAICPNYEYKDFTSDEYEYIRQPLQVADKRPAMTLTTSPAASFDGKTFSMTSHAVASFTGAGEGYSYRTEIIYKDIYDPYNNSKKITINDDGTFTNQNLYSEQNVITAGTVKVLDSATIILTAGSDTFKYILSESQLASLPSRLEFDDDRPMAKLAVQATSNGVQLTVTDIPANTSSFIIRRNKVNSDRVAVDSYIDIRNPSNSTFSVNDYFVKSGVEYRYSIESVDNQSYNLNYKNVVPNNGFGELAISNSPVANYDSQTKHLIFTTEPEFSVESLNTKLAGLSDSYRIENRFLYGKGENPYSFYCLDYDFNSSKSVYVGWRESGEWHLHQRYDSIVYLTNNNQTIKYCYGTDLSVLFSGMPTITIE